MSDLKRITTQFIESEDLIRLSGEAQKKVAQKSGLNRSILDQGWGEFRRQLGDKVH